MRCPPRAPWIVAAGWGLAAAFLTFGPGVAGAAEPACKESFDRVQKAVEARSAETVVGCMQAEGTLTIRLLGEAGGTEPMKREQALRVLRMYFEKVSQAKLKVREGQALDALVRTFDYTRRLRGGDAQTTRLTITLRKDAQNALHLYSIVESAR